VSKKPPDTEQLTALDRARAVVKAHAHIFADLDKECEVKELELKRKYGAAFKKEATRFVLNRAEQAVVDEWVESLRPEIMAAQGKQFDTISPDTPYYGAVGGGLTYSFTPTGLGDIIVVKESITGKELNVSEALDWYFYG
jgi:hypothetical protein